ncbi:MAG: penicillin-binding protein 2 [Pseudomonadota bacterium]
MSTNVKQRRKHARRTSASAGAQLGLFDPVPANSGGSAQKPSAPQARAPEAKSSSVFSFGRASSEPGRLESRATVQALPVQPMPSRDEMIRIRRLLLNTAQFRALLLILAFAALAMMGAVKLAAIGFDKRASASAAASTTLVPLRGEITDRTGQPLARVYRTYSMWFNANAMKDAGPPLVNSAQEVARQLKAIFPEMDEARTIKRLSPDPETGEYRSTYLLRDILPEDANRVLSLGEIAIETPREPKRHYPQGKLAAHVLGRTVENENGVEVGAFGMEKALERELSDPELRANPQALSIDLRVQGALEDEMRRGMLASRADGAAGVVLDVDTGEVMAMASLPDFDPNRISQKDAANVGNRVTYVRGELGSVFKPLTVAAGLDAGVVRDLSASWNARPVEAGGRMFKDYEHKGDRLNIPQALAYSSNTVTMRVANELGGERLREVMIELGMNKAPNIELDARGAPFWPQDKKWSMLTTMTVGYGHGISVTPLHLANAYAAMVNGGIYRDATLKRIDPGTKVAGKRVFKASTSQRMRQLLRMVAIFGTGRLADKYAEGYRVGGKTGSAEKLIKGRYVSNKLISTFAAAFPMDRPRYVVVVALDEPKITDAVSGRTAYHNAAPIVGKTIARAGPMLGVRPDNSRDVDISDLRNLIEGRK